MSRKEGGRGLASIKDSVDASIRRLEDYIKKKKERLITATRNKKKNSIKGTTIPRKQKRQEKQLYGYSKHQTNLTRENLDTESETESLLIAAQNNAIRTNYFKAKKTQQNSKCRLGGDSNKTINHIISKWGKLAQKEYKTRHDWVKKVINREFCWKLKFDHTNK